ncbi:hypothetical protein BBK36DRAFT_1134104 [Trichoderma citrinoviride]|uniref:Dynein heavy chain, cytosolic n=1 Tax=Trichoderma citrinoviride TaxID=58853 RepID=A0A2T4BNP0_9HYPO|nr:hypothetical protein BBK36DRAFT_1134104 [Trichoderma citrinoviride]PTB70906.1 hypothetical protein BBK36DRAFT_1134104 [Trichoderma citrinoviride]
MEVTSATAPSLGASSSNGASLPAPPSPTPTPTPFPTIDPERVVEHLVAICEVALGASRSDLELPGNLLHKASYAETVSRCTRFANDSLNVLYIQKDLVQAGALENGNDAADAAGEHSNGVAAPATYDYTLSTEISSTPTTVATLILLKASQAIDSSRPLTSQIFITNLPGPASLNAAAGEQGVALSPWEVLHSQVHHALVPYFDANSKSQLLANGSRGRDVDAKTGIPVTKKRLNDLELSLLHLQQNVDIPEISLTFHSLIQNVLDDAEVSGMKPSIEAIPKNLLQDSSFLNKLQANVNTWIKSIQGITKLTKETSSNAVQEFSTASQEVNFWLSMESALEGIEDQLRSEGVLLTLDILKHAKRFQATVSFVADTGLKEAKEKAQKYNQLMRDFPLDELLSAPSLLKVEEAITQIFAHLMKKLRVCPYPIRRALSLAQAISADLNDVLLRLLPGTELVNMGYPEFQNVMRTCDSIFAAWEDNIKEFTHLARMLIIRRNEKRIPINVEKNHSELESRIKYVSAFRDNHEQLQRTIVNVLGPKAILPGVTDVTAASSSSNATAGAVIEEMGDVDAVEEVKRAWEALQNVDLLDVTDQGKERWAQAENLYNERSTRVENSIIARLRDRLATAKTANEMFRVFSKFNALFVRPKIRGAIQEYQNQLMDHVKQAINGLHERFKQQYGHSEAHAMAQLRDLPPVSGAIIWARQIELQLDGYMKKVEAVLGPDWTLHAEGHKLQEESELFKNKLDTGRIYDAWLADANRRKISIAGQLFNINRVRSAGGILELNVNFDPQIITLFKETRNLTWQSYLVPHAVTTVSKDAKRVYPYAVSLMEGVRTLSQTLRQIGTMGEESILLNGYKNEVYKLISDGVPLRWESFVNSHELFYADQRQIRPLLPGSTGFGPAKNTESKHGMFIWGFSAAVSVLQSKTATLNSIYATIEQALKDLGVCPYDAAAFQSHLDTIQSAVDQLNLEQYANLDFWVRGVNHKVQTILLERLSTAVQAWIAAFEQDVAEEDRRKLSKEDDGKQDGPTMKRLILEITMRNQVIYLDPPLEYARASWFLHLHDWLGIVCNLRKIKATRYQMSLNTDAQEEARFTDLPSHFEKKLREVSIYVDKWLQFQSLWDLQSDQVYDMLGDHLPRWLECLQDIRKVRTTFDTQEVSRSFGHITIDYDQVQTKVNAKYDQWQQEILIKFANRLGNRMRDINADIEKARRNLEGQSSDTSSTAAAVQFITAVQSCRRNAKLWAPEIDMFRQGQSTLVRQRYPFPNDWLHIEQIESQWEALKEILEKKSKIMEEQSDAMRANIIAQDKLINERIGEVVAQWNEEKPVSGTIQPDTRITALQEEFQQVMKAREALDIPGNNDSILEITLEEVRDFRSVWSNLSTIWTSLNETRDMLWTAVQPRKIRQKVDDLIKSTKDMPSRMRQYAAFEHVQGVLRGFLKVNNILSDLKSDAIRERHWHKIYKQIKPQKRFSPSSMTLGDVWDLNLTATEVIMALEEFLKQMVNYQNKCRLIRGWDDLFAKCSENLNSLQAMKHSPYYKEFEEDAVAWEDKLNRVHVLFDVWIDVQRQWVYLEGVFTGNADIKHLLPIESGRFQNINSEFLAVMKKANKTPYVLDRLAEMLNKIQKALGEYLEKERVSFPRFYFVGDEDLLEMIGNSNDTLRIAKHFKKMFAGLAGLIMDDEGVISGFTSKEGEATPRINDWLALLENGMKQTLAELLAKAVEEYTPIFESESIDREALIVVLATQAVWTTATLKALFEREVQVLRVLAETVLGDLEVIQRKKCEQLITECVHQRDVIEKLVQLQMRYVYTPEGNFLNRLYIKMANAKLNYGFEYLGVPERLVRTPLTDRCSPYGPAGTGKTESVKALGVQLGRFTLAMGRIFLGICQRILSAGAENDKSQIELVGRQLRVNENTGIFITMNPGYAGRSNLPDNLKKLFRSVAMSKPDKELIAEAKRLSKQTLSKQAHYDFGLRALKSVLVSSGEIVEPEILLIKSDVDIMFNIEEDCFPGVQYAIRTLAAERHLVVTDLWMTKVLQLYQIQKIHHGVMMVGNSGTGKSAAWRLLLDALQKVENVEGVSHVIDSKWTDGLFTSILRKIRHWIVFDGDVDPEWVENLNSRLNLPANVRIMFEVETLKYATLATVSRCGMVCVPFEDLDEDSVATGQSPAKTLAVQAQEDFFTVARAHADFPLEYDQIEGFVAKKLLLALLFGDDICAFANFGSPPLDGTSSLIDFDNQVPSIEVNTHSIIQTDVVIPTLDTVRHEDPLLLCGPPGSGKTMTLFSALRKLPNMEVTFEQYCEYKKTLNGVMLSPTQIGRWLYGTQRAISFLRQLSWVTLDRIQFVGACNPPTDAGRTPMGARFLRHAPLVMIYGTFNAAPLTHAMIQPHYVYSPRELTRWVRGLIRIWAHEALRLFQDRLTEKALGGPILFSNWLSKNYVPVDREQLRDFEEVDVPLILFNDVLEHVLRIDRVFRQPQGHLILIGVSGDFDEDLRDICFIMDEANVLDSGFLERMNTLLANAEVPGLFEGDDHRQNLHLDSPEELYKWFTQQIVNNLHVAATSPALFNRCALFQSNFNAPDTIPTVVNSMKLLKQQGKVTFLTPRHFLDFVTQYEQQRHLNVGLEKLRDTVDKKKAQLEQKDAEANEKLQRMNTSLEIQAALEKQEAEVAMRKKVVLEDLAKAEPAVEEAKASVSNIKRQHLVEVRGMSNPPQSVRLALDAAVQAVMMTKGLRNKMRNEFLSNPEFTFEKVNHASRACGPLVQWVIAQVSYSDILDRVGPLREETKASAMATEYATLISETQAIKAEMSKVQFKVDRSRARWEEGSKSFETQISTLVGDVLTFRKNMFKSPNPRLGWQENTLPRFNRYPLIIDPSGRDRRLTLESSLRFGNPILIQDAEHLDPILNHVLNKEYQRTGGRLYLSTRDPSATSLQTQSLNDVLKSERPDLQGEFKALNESRGNILDDDKAADISDKMRNTEGVMAESCSAVFAFSLQYFLDIFQSETNHNVRRDIIVKDLFKDRITLAMLLAQASPYKMDKSMIDVILDDRIAGEAAFQDARKLSVLKEKLDAELAEAVVPKALYSLLLVKLFRMDRFVPAAERFAALVFGSDIFDIVEDLKEIVSQVSATLPIALVLVQRMGVRADKAVSSAAETGSWVLIKNKRMESLNPHSDFRLFLSMESSPKIPVNLLRASRVLMYEQPAGVRANMKDSMSSLSTRAVKSPVERTRLYLLISFLHAVGFWEFNDSDYECCAFIIDVWIESVAGNRTNIAPQNIPWDMIRYLVTETYGGKIDDEGDFSLLRQLVTSFLTPAAYDADHKLVDGPDGGLLVPSGTGLQDFMAWVHKLPEREPPTYLGLPANAEKLLLVGLGRSLVENLRKVTGLLDENERLVTDLTDS